MVLIDKLCYTSRLRYTNAGIKVLFAMLTLLFCVMDRSISLSVLIILVPGYLTTVVGGVSFFRYLRFLSIPLAFLILSTLAIAVNFSSEPLSAFAIPMFGFYLTGSKASVLSGVQLTLTALGSISCLYFLSLSTPVTDILGVMKKLRLPSLLIELMLLIYRFIFILLDIADALNTAQKSRLGNVNFRTSCKSAGSLIGTLFIRSFKKSSFLYDAMESRCYDGHIHVLQEHYPVSKKQIALLAAFELTLIILSAALRCLGLHI